MAKYRKTLTTKRFELRPMTAADAPKLADLGADPDVVKNLIFDWSTPALRLEIAKFWIRHHQETDLWGVIDRDQVFVGFLAVDETLPESGQGPEIYYAFRQDRWGQGVASEVVRAGISHLFAEQGAAAVEALVLAGLNPASIELLEKLGMKLVGRYPLADYVGSACRPTMDYEVWRVANAPPERAEQTLQEAAFKIGQFVADGISSKAEMAAALERAAAGLANRLGEETVQRLINQHLEAGLTEAGWLHYRVLPTTFSEP
ncbi:MAG: GNAT family N-acetyltransferase [Pseudomonadota bacterium]